MWEGCVSPPLSFSSCGSSFLRRLYELLSLSSVYSSVYCCRRDPRDGILLFSVDCELFTHYAEKCHTAQQSKLPPISSAIRQTRSPTSLTWIKTTVLSERYNYYRGKYGFVTNRIQQVYYSFSFRLFSEFITPSVNCT